MNHELSNAVAKLIERAEAVGQSGKKATANAMTQLASDMGGRIPPWYVELLVSYPLGGLEIGWQEDEPDEDHDGIVWMEWSSPDNIRSESLECYPGLAILEMGWINVASDAMGGGDPYFIPTDTSDNPPVFQVYHDVSDKAEVILAKACRQVAPSLAELFLQAKLAKE